MDPNNTTSSGRVEMLPARCEGPDPCIVREVLMLKHDHHRRASHAVLLNNCTCHAAMALYGNLQGKSDELFVTKAAADD